MTDLRHQKAKPPEAPLSPALEDEMVVAERAAPGLAPQALARAWLQAHGVGCEPSELKGMLVEALDQLPVELQLDSGEELTSPELSTLARGGLGPVRRRAAVDPLARGAAEYAALLQTALDVNSAAKRARVSPARIRQRLNSAPRSLVGVRIGNTWRVPLFQFDGRGSLLPGIERVVEAIDPEVHVLAVQRWFLGEHVDLADGEDEERRLSPRDWLRLGRTPERLVELAREL